MRRRAAAALLAAAVATGPASAAGPSDRPLDRLPDRWGAALSAGKSYGPTGKVWFQTATLVRDRDYGRSWSHPAPAALRQKLELTVGAAEVPEARLLASANVLAVRAIDPWVTPRVRPYVEAGIGVVYTDFRIDGQGLRWNFNPVVGAGAEFPAAGGRAAFVALRGHHVSNGGLHPDNTGINSVVLTTGVLW